jgi:hypothetical protein
MWWIWMFERIREKIERKRAKSFVENVQAWYQTSRDISEVMDMALHDQSIIQADIGYIIDGADRMLFHLRFYIPDSLGRLRRRNPDLARRFDLACQQLFKLRNETTRFLIRSQGPGPMSGDDPDDEARILYYYQALEEVGFNARDIKLDFDRELKSIWHDLQLIIVQEKASANL